MIEHSQHWYNPETGQAECECCCKWALDYESLRKDRDGYARLVEEKDNFIDACEIDISSIRASIAEFLAHDGGNGSEDYDSRKYLDARRKLQQIAERK